MPEPNEVTVFSNGIADFRRRFQVPRGREQVISLAYRRDHIGDVLGSLNVFGPVRIIRPPAYRYTNANAPTLVIPPDDAIPGLLRSFSGAKVRVWTRGGGDEGLSGTILGLDKLDEVIQERLIKRTYLGLYGADRKLHRLAIDDLTGYRFESDADNAEIAKALSRNYQAIKPESTFVDLTLSTLEGATEDAEAIVQGVIPLSAWKMTYRIEAGPDGYRLEGLAIVDNNTDEDWTNFLVSVVTGEPNTFATDLAVAKTPSRRLVNLVPESALGGFQAAEGFPGAKGAGPARSVAAGAPMATMAPRRMGGYGGGPGDEVTYDAEFEDSVTVDSFLIEARAGRDEAEASSVGEFQVFRSKAPVDIPAQSSALVPMFSRELGDARTILIYNEREMPRHPFRAIRLVNDTGLNLNKGSCAVFREGVFSGLGILDHSKPGEVRLVPHSLELGVIVLKQSDPLGTRLVRIKVADGAMVREVAENLRTTFLLKNKLDEPFTFVLEYNQLLADSEMSIAGPEVSLREKTPAGLRSEFPLAPGTDPIVVTVEETRLKAHEVYLNEHTLATFGEKDRLIDDPRVVEAMKIQGSIERAKRELARQQAARKAAIDKQSRVQQLVASARGGGHQANEWMKDLAETEKTIRELDERVIPGLTAELDALHQKIGEALKAIRATWEDPVVPTA